MSIEQQPPKPGQIPVDKMPPYPHSDEDTVIPAPEHRDDKHEKKNTKRNIAIGAAGAVLTAVVGGGAVLGLRGSDSPESGKSETTSQSAKPHNVESETPVVVNEEYIQSINRDPSPEAIEYSLQPVLVKDYTPEEATIRLLDDLKLYWMGGTPDYNVASPFAETPESQKLGEQQLNVIFGPENKRQGLAPITIDEWLHQTRGIISTDLDYLTKEGSGYPKDATFNFTCTELEDMGSIEGRNTIKVLCQTSSNIHQLDSERTYDFSKNHISVRYNVTLDQHEGAYYIAVIDSDAA